VVHPQSVIHSMVQFEDTSVIAQLGQPDMRLPIQYALSYPERLNLNIQPLDFATLGSLTFEKPDTDKFRNLAFAYESVAKAGNMPCIMNAANEIAVASFLREEIGFLPMSDVIEYTMQKVSFLESPSLDDYFATDAEARMVATELIQRIK